jgi:predicted dehydrogenase
MSQKEVVKWGIIGTASIAKKNVRAMLLAQDNCLLVGIASRTMRKAEEFLEEMSHFYRTAGRDTDLEKIRLYEGYDALLSDPKIDAVYVPLPTSLHLEWAVKAAEAGKHILLEKPCALRNSDLVTILEACKKNNVVFMDGVMFMHNQRLSTLRATLQDPLFGEIQSVSTSFSFNGGGDFLKSNIRISSTGDALGAVGDLGWYCIRLGIIAFNRGLEMRMDKLDKLVLPLKVTARCSNWSVDGVPLDCDAKVSFNNGGDNCWSSGVLSFTCSFLRPFQQRFDILAAKGTMKTSSVCDKILSCDDFVIPRSPPPASSSMHLETFPSGGFPLDDYASRVMSFKEEIVTQHFLNGSMFCHQNSWPQDARMFSEFSRMVLSRRDRMYMAYVAEEEEGEEKYWLLITLLTQCVIDACLDSIKSGEEVVPDTSFLSKGLL